MGKITLLTSEEINELVDEALKRALEMVETPTKQKDCLMTREETAKFLKINLSTLNEWTKKGYLNSYAIGYRRYYKEEEILKALVTLNKKHNGS